MQSQIINLVPTLISLKDQLNGKIRNFMKVETFERQKSFCVEVDKHKFTKNDKNHEEISSIRLKILNKYKKIGHNDILIELLNMIKNTAYEVSKTQYCPSKMSIYI